GGTVSNGQLILNDDVTVASASGVSPFTSFFFGNVSLGSATRTFTVNGVLDVQGNLSGAPGIGLIKEGPGLLKITGTSTYTGPTTINAGIMQVDPFTNGPTKTLQSPITVNDGGTLAGFTASSIAPNAISVESVGGTVSPGRFFSSGGDPALFAV